MLKRIISVFASTVLALSLFSAPAPIRAEESKSVCAPRYELPKSAEIWDGSVASSFAGGSGTESDPFLISNGAELALLADIVNNAVYDTFGLYYELTSDIYLNDISDCESWSKQNAPANVWQPIGYNSYEINNGTVIITSTHAFKGVFDGGGYTVNGVYVNTLRSDDGFAPYMEGSGLFGASHYAVFRNVNLAHSFISSEAISVGGIVGWLARGGYIAESDHSIANCRIYPTCRILGFQNVGGIIGLAQTCYQGIYDCVNEAQVTGGNGVGGIAGGVYRVEDKLLTFARCLNLGSISSTATIAESYSAGGIAGYHVGNAYECANFGAISAACAAGGLFGDIDSGTIVRDCFNSGHVSADYEAGGLCGVSSSGCAFTSCYNAGIVDSAQQRSFGALIGLDSGSPTAFTSCYYLNTSCEYADKIVGTARTDAELRGEQGYQGFDFETVWFMNEATEYPYAELRSLELPSYDPEPTIPGDLDGDGLVTSADAVLALRASLGLIALDEAIAERADLDGDGLVTSADAVLILRLSLGLRLQGPAY